MTHPLDEVINSMCSGHSQRRPSERPGNHPIEQEMRDAYWNAKDEFEHDIRELWAQYISPEEFETKWRPRLKSEGETK